MTQFELSAAERKRRREIADHTRQMILSKMDVVDEDETSLMTSYCNYYLQISFSKLHPLMVICLAKSLEHPSSTEQRRIINHLNLQSILGSHAINDDAGCYAYRATQWLDAEMGEKRFYEILDRCVDEAERGYHKFAG